MLYSAAGFWAFPVGADRSPRIIVGLVSSWQHARRGAFSVEIQLQREDGFQFRAEGPSGYPLRIASSAGEGKRPEGVGSMEMVAMGLAGCSSTDIVLILEKQNQSIDAYRVDLEARRAENETPAVFRDLHLQVHIEGDVAPHKAQRAVELSLEKYCSVAHMLRETAEIRYSLTVNGEEVARHADYG